MPKYWLMAVISALSTSFKASITFGLPFMIPPCAVKNFHMSKVGYFNNGFGYFIDILNPCQLQKSIVFLSVLEKS